MSHTNIVYLRNEDGHPVGCLAVLSTPEDPSVTISASICAPEDKNKFEKTIGAKIALRRLTEVSEKGPRVVRSSTDTFEEAVACMHSDSSLEQNIGMETMANLAMLAIIRSGAPVGKLDALDIVLNPAGLAACERYARKGRGRASQ